jgi:Ca2+/Na+ antiporter
VWHESIVLILLYVVFFVSGIFFKKLREIKRKKKQQKQQRLPDDEMIEEISMNLLRTKMKTSNTIASLAKTNKNDAEDDITIARVPVDARRLHFKLNNLSAASSISSSGWSNFSDALDHPYSLLKPYRNIERASCKRRLGLILMFPAKFAAFITIIDFRRFDGSRIKPLVLAVTILLSLAWIAACSYMFVWMNTIVAQTFSISYTLLGFTFIAMVTSIKETMASVQMCEHEMGKFNANQTSLKHLRNLLSAIMNKNMYDLSIGMGLTYLINSLLFSVNDAYLATSVYSQNVLLFTITGLIVCLLVYMIIMFAFRFKPGKLFGFTLIFVWLLFTIFVVLIEFNVINLFSRSKFFGLIKCSFI